MIIQKNIPLNDKNWFKTGGPARFFAEPATNHEFQEALAFAQLNGLAIFILGEGANVLISDDGFDDLVIRPKLNQISALGLDEINVTVTAGAGVSINMLIEWCLAHQIGGLEEFSGIPGTVGGSVFINLHYFEFLLSHFLTEATVIEKSTGSILAVNNEWFNFDYDYSTLHSQEFYLLDATFKLKKLTELQTAFARGRRTEIIRHRIKRYPTSGTCGSFFRNFLPHEYAQEKTGVKLPYVAYYLDKLGFKGALSVGGASVSHQHANMIVNKGAATSSDIINLVRIMQDKTREQFGLIPQPECIIVGYKKCPL